MKKTLFIAAIAATLCSCGNNQKFVIDGTIADLEGSVYLFQKDSLIDSAVVNEGKFRFEGTIAQPESYFIFDSRVGEPQDFAMRLFVEPGTITIKSDVEDPNVKHVTGTPANDASEAYMIASRKLFKEYRDPATTEDRRTLIEKEANDMTRTAVEANLNNLFGVALIPNLTYELTPAESMEIIGRLSPEMQLREEIVSLKKNIEQQAKTDIGQPYIDIVQNNAKGEPVSLKSVIENPAIKFTLVDFWASWCSPCMEEVPELIRTYDAFKSKGFEIYGVSFDAKQDAWLGAVESKKMNWIQVSELNRFDNKAAKDYAIQGIPSNFLIDANGVIVAKNLRGEALYEKVAELLK